MAWLAQYQNLVLVPWARINPEIFVVAPFTFFELFVSFHDLWIFLCLVLIDVSLEFNTDQSGETIPGFQSLPSL